MTSVSVVIETLNVRGLSSNAMALDGVLDALSRQTRQPDEIVLVLTDAIEDDSYALRMRSRHPPVRVLRLERCNYFQMKNRGAASASSEIVAFIDSDAMPGPEWLESLMSAIDAGADVVAGRTVYDSSTRFSRTFTAADFSNVVRGRNGEATGFNLNNVAFRTDVILNDPLDERIPRDGACYLLFHTLRARGRVIAYEPRATATHGIGGGVEFVRRHFNRGFDGFVVYRLDAHRVLRGSGFVQRTSLALIPLTVRRIVVDCLRLVRARRQIGVTRRSIPFHAFVMVGIRTIELVGGMTAARRWQPESTLTACN